MSYYWYRGDRRQLWLPTYWHSENIKKLTPVQWRVRWACLVSHDDTRHLFRRRLARAIHEYGLNAVVAVLDETIADPHALMLPMDGRAGYGGYVKGEESDRARRSTSARIMEALGHYRPMFPEFVHIIGRNMKQDVSSSAAALAATSRPEAAPYLISAFHCYAKDHAILPFANVVPGISANICVSHIPQHLARLVGADALPLIRQIVRDSGYDWYIRQQVPAALKHIRCLESILLAYELLQSNPSMIEAKRVLESSRLRTAVRLLRGEHPDTMPWCAHHLQPSSL